MGTRSTVKFYGEYDMNCIASIYQQYDGYPECVGYELAVFLEGIQMVNGFGYGAKLGEVANGMGCLASQYIAKIKVGVGRVYMVEADNLQEYNYTIHWNDEAEDIEVNVFDWENKLIFTGNRKEFVEFCEDYGGDYCDMNNTLPN